MSRADRARREHASRRLESRPRPPAGPDARRSSLPPVRALARRALPALALGLVWACLTALAVPAQAQTEVPFEWALKPAEVTGGGTFRLIFATSAKRDATATDIDTYNTFVQGQAAAGHDAIQAYSSSFQVVGCTEDEDALGNTSTNYTASDTGVPIYWLNGNKVADDSSVGAVLSTSATTVKTGDRP